MDNFQKNWWLYFISECYFDTVLLKRLLQTNKRLMHRKGCNNVVRDLDSKRLRDSFAVGVVDKDRVDLDYLKSCEILKNADKIILWKHVGRNQFVIQLNPPLEKWIIEILEENNLSIEEFGYSREYKKLKKGIKDDIDSEADDKLNRLVSAIIKTDCVTIRRLRSILQLLKERNDKIDINELKNV